MTKNINKERVLCNVEQNYVYFIHWKESSEWDSSHQSATIYSKWVTSNLNHILGRAIHWNPYDSIIDAIFWQCD